MPVASRIRKLGLRVLGVATIAGTLAWAANSAPLVPTGDTQGPGVGYGYGAGKVTICHYPPGNPGNAHTITVGQPAVAAHIANHGDTLGACIPVVTANSTSQQEGSSNKPKPHGNSGGHGNSGNAPGHSGSTTGSSGGHGNSGNAPGHSGSTTGSSGGHGNSGNAPGHSGGTTGSSGGGHGNSDNAPGHSGGTPGNSGNAPGHSGGTPGNSGGHGNSGGGHGNSGNHP